MGGILKNWRMLGAVLFATVIIGGAFVLARGAATPPTAQASEESALLAAIASRDSDSDGLADWEEALYGTDPHDSDTRELGMTDGEAVAQGLIIPKAIADVPGVDGSGGTVVDPDLPPAPDENTLTAAFAKNVFTLYLDRLQANGGQLADQDLADIANEALGQLGSTITAAPPFKKAQDIQVKGAGAEAMRAWAASVEAVMRANTANASASELAYLKRVVEDGDTGAAAHIASIAKAYRMSAAGIAALTVPQELARDALMLVNALARHAEVTNDLSRVDDDPLVTMIALQAYPQVTVNLVDAFIAVERDFRTAGVTLAPGEPGASVVNLVADIAAEQEAAGAD